MTEKLQNKATKPLWKNTLVPVSFARSSEKALKTAFDIARRQGSELFARRVANDPIVQSEAGIGRFSSPGAWPRELKHRRWRFDRLVAKRLERTARESPVTKLIVEGALGTPNSGNRQGEEDRPDSARSPQRDRARTFLHWAQHRSYCGSRELRRADSPNSPLPGGESAGSVRNCEIHAASVDAIIEE